MKVDTHSGLCKGQTMISWQLFFACKLMWNHWWKR